MTRPPAPVLPSHHVPLRCRRMAIGARHGKMGSCQRKACVAMPHDGEHGRRESLHVVTVFAAVLVRCRRELPLVDILVAGSALRAGNRKDSVLAFGLVAGRTRDGGVASNKRVGRRSMRFYVERGRLESGDGMTRRALAVIGSSDELAAVCVLVAVGAPGVRHWQAEVAAPMARAAGRIAMFPVERKRGFGVVEARHPNRASPARGGVAGLTGSRQAAFVRVGVAAAALGEGEARVDRVRLGAGSVRMTFRAVNRGMCARQRELPCGVVEPGRRLPSVGRVAARAGRAELSTVFVGVATRTIPREPQERVVQVLDLNGGARSGRNFRRLVTRCAGDADMLARKRETRLGMVQALAAGLPADEWKVSAVVIGMAGGTGLSVLVGGGPHRVHAPPVGQPLADLGVAGEALQLAASADLVTLRAVQRTTQRLVRPRQRSRRNLPVAWTHTHQTKDNDQDDKDRRRDSGVQWTNAMLRKVCVS